MGVGRAAVRLQRLRTGPVITARNQGWATDGGIGAAGRGRDRRARLAAQRAAEQQAKARNRRLLLAGGSIVVVVAVVLAVVLLAARGGSSGPTSGNAAAAPTGSALTSVVGQLTSVPAGTLD